MTHISYMLQPGDKARVKEILARLAPGMSEDDAFRILARCSNWSEEQVMGDWPEGATIASKSDAEEAWRKEDPEVAARVAGLSTIPWMSTPPLVDLVVAGLFQLDQKDSTASDLSLSALASIATRLRKQASPTRTLVSSSIGAEGVAELCGRDKVMIMSPRNQRDLLHAGGCPDEEREFPWLVMHGRLDQAACRALWRACVAGEDPADAAGIRVEEVSDPACIPDMLEGKTPVFYARQDFRDMTGESDIFVDTLFLAKLAPGRRGYYQTRLGVRGFGYLHDMLDIGRMKDPSSAYSMSRAFLRVVSEAVGAESKWHPPGSLARAVEAGGKLPDLCGPELTN